ncbi:MAG: hypothetical protein KAH77_08390, partial [Thiomargarita sp.]|nr:hypothetical protein [Thiomargarita sp.]
KSQRVRVQKKDALRPTTQRVVLGIPTLARGNEKFLFNFNELFLKLMAVGQRPRVNVYHMSY